PIHFSNQGSYRLHAPCEKSRQISEVWSTKALWDILCYGMGAFHGRSHEWCYHVCPNYSNFQFDTAFMYILGILCSLRLYQARHHDIFINGHFAFAGFAFVIFTSVIGVVYRSEGFFITFCFFHIMACFYLSLQIYYMGRAKTALVLMWHSRGYKICSRPQYPVRFMLLVVFMGINIALSLYGVTNEVKDFATFLLGIIICNGLLYVGFYCIMKLYCGEKIKLFPVIFALASMVTWGIAIKFFVAGLTDWQVCLLFFCNTF
uniref:Uncharacterized protein n=1 Tax=Clytia hemisphaerica TaxID=252671 RepID=A0A7M5XMY0_9CNID